jgi:pimeloyl-ACP methyl ester carboxylesterase
MKSEMEIGGPVYVDRFGRSGPAMVLLHGLGSSHVHWLAVTRSLAVGHQLFVPDLPGFGRSPLKGRRAGVEAYARLVDQLLDKVLDRVDGPLYLVGHSMGALIAMLVAANRPEDMAGLVLVAPPAPRPVRAPLERNLAIMFYAYAWPGLGELTRELWVRAQGRAGMVRRTFEVCCSAPDRVPPEVLKAALELSAERSPGDDVHSFLDAYRSTWTYLLNGHRFDRLVRSIESPTLVIRGTADKLVPTLVANRLPKLRPDWTFVTLDGIGHMPQVDDPESFTAAVRGWLTSRRARRPARIRPEPRREALI